MDAYTHACACTPTRKYTGALLRNQHTWYALSLTLQAGKLMRVVGTRSLGVKASMLAGNVLPLQTAHTCIRIDMYARPTRAHMHTCIALLAPVATSEPGRRQWGGTKLSSLTRRKLRCVLG